MKKLYKYTMVCLATCFCGAIAAQSVNTKHNNLTAATNSHGILFQNTENATAGLTHTTENVALIYSANLWLSAMTQNSEIGISAGTYKTDFSPGTTRRDDQIDSSVTMITVNSSEVQSHIDNYSDSGYYMPPAIKNWPTHIVNLDGSRTSAAPFIDLNNNNQYEPEKGDYPDILGNTFTFVILNDTRGLRQGSGATPVGVDVFLSVFSWDLPSDEAISNSIIVNYKIINTSFNSYNKLHKGMFIDFDLGNPSDDYIGTDSTSNFVYAYNGDNDDDEAIGPSPGFGTNPPAIGAQIICGDLSSSMYFNFGTGPQGDPSLPSDYHNLIQGLWKDGSPLRAEGSGYRTTGYITSFALNGAPENGSGWTETNAGNVPGDRRILLASTEENEFKPGDTQSFTIAFSYARDNAKNNIENITTLRNTFGSIGRFLDSEKSSMSNYWSDNFSCQLVGVDENISKTISIHPNPTTDYLNIENAESYASYKILSIDGKTLTEGSATESLDVRNLKPGIYHLQLTKRNGSFSTTKFLKN